MVVVEVLVVVLMEEFVAQRDSGNGVGSKRINGRS